VCKNLIHAILNGSSPGMNSISLHWCFQNFNRKILTMFRIHKKKVRLNYKNCFSRLIQSESNVDLHLIILTTNYFTLSQFDREGEGEIHRVLITRTRQV